MNKLAFRLLAGVVRLPWKWWPAQKKVDKLDFSCRPGVVRLL